MEIPQLLARIKGCKDDAELLSLVGDLSLKLIENNYPYVPRVIAQIAKVNDNMGGNGVVHLELKMYKGDVTEAVFHEVTKLRFDTATHN